MDNTPYLKQCSPFGCNCIVLPTRFVARCAAGEAKAGAPRPKTVVGYAWRRDRDSGEPVFRLP